MAIEKTKIGIIGCGNISSTYFTVARTFEILDVVACADRFPERAQAKAAEFGVKAMSVEDLLADPDIKIVVNLTVPLAHAEVGLQTLKAGKCAYAEKPIAWRREDGTELLALAAKKGLLVGGAPDTFMGGGQQTARKLIDDGWIGEPIGFSAFNWCRGHERWHPDPIQFYKPGGGPILDRGPYLITALVALLGPCKSVSASARATWPERIATCQQHYGERIKVEVPTHITGTMEMANGAVGTILTTYDVWATELPSIEIYGSEGTLKVPDPNGFGGSVQVKRSNAKEWAEVQLTHGYIGQGRSLGVADMAYALRSGRPHRANGELAYHVADVMIGLLESAEQGKHIQMTSTCKRPAPLPLGLRDGILDE